jgi:hypothetical protein
MVNALRQSDSRKKTHVRLADVTALNWITIFAMTFFRLADYGDDYVVNAIVHFQ